MTDTGSIKIHILHTGLVQVDKALPFHGLFRNPLAFTGIFRSQKNQMILPVSSYLIEHPKGLILIDTGWNKIIRQSNWKELGLQMIINKGYLPAGWAIDEQLSRLGYKPSDIDYLLLSHLHGDHVSGLRQVKDAKNILVSKDEWESANHLPIAYIPRQWKGINVKTYSYSPTQIGPFAESFDLFGDGSVVQVHTPGHTTGMSATLIKGSDEKYVLLATDNGYMSRSWEEMLTPGIVVSRKDSIVSLAWVRELAHDKNCVAAIANHDPKVNSQVIELKY